MANPTLLNGGVILRSGVLGVFKARSLSANGKEASTTPCRRVSPPNRIAVTAAVRCDIRPSRKPALEPRPAPLAEGALPLASARRAAIASSSLSRCPSAVTPSSFRFSCVKLGMHSAMERGAGGGGSQNTTQRIARRSPRSLIGAARARDARSAED
jgi:hypothetical protein